MTEKNTQWYAEKYINKFSMALVPIKPKSKLPIRGDWGENTLDTDAEADQYYTANPTHNVGLSLGKSGYCSLDIDCEESFRLILEEYGISADALDDFPTIQGSPKGRRLLFRVPADLELRYAKLDWPRQEDDTKRYTVLELRAAAPGGKQRFDVLPPSIHPDTKDPYTWTVQPATPWPEPPAWLLAIWQAWDKFKPQLKAVCPWAPEAEPPTRAKPTRGDDKDGSVIDKYTAANSLHDALTTYGYTQVGRRWLSPHSSTKLPGVVLFPGEKTCWIHHASDPLCSDETGKPVNAFDLYCYYDHGGDASRAVKAAASALGLNTPSRQRKAKTSEAPAETDEKKEESTSTGVVLCHFRPLGYCNTHYYYLPRATEQVAEISRRSHTSAADLLALAPLEWWESSYPKEGGKQGGADWQLAGSDLMRMCERRGIYSPDTERGRGAWYDAGRAVLHLGDRLLIDGQPARIADHVSQYIYTRQAATEADIGTVPASDEQAADVLDIIKQINWTKESYADLAAGWIALAPICGALRWRPHVWMTAQRGSGKSWIQEHIVYPLVGSSALHVQGGTTEAGIRQRLKQDARPIVFDEAEPDGMAGQKRIQSVIELARQASSDSGAEIVKGTSGGEGMSFRARSMFLMGSVNVALVQAADESRFTVLSLDAPERNPEEIDRFNRFSKQVDATLTREFCAALRARVYRMIPVIRENAQVFARAVAEELGSQRIGDQVGTLLAGSHALRSSEGITLDDARALVSGLDFEDARETEQVSDEINCMDAILQAQIRLDNDDGRQVTRTVSELILAACGRQTLPHVSGLTAGEVLERHGLRVDSDALVVANRHAEIARMLQNTPWYSGWKTILKRIDGASAMGGPLRMAGVLCRCTRVPIRAFL